MKVGLEFHQRLDAQEKLFCNCSTDLKQESEYLTVKRKLHPVVSELGDIDEAARAEAIKNKTFDYLITKDNTCLVELDEEPPRKLNQEALEITLLIAKMLHTEIFPEVFFMRKTVVDGSNTAGFQRTALIGKNGYFEFKGKKIPINYVILEEEAAGIVKKTDKEDIYRLDRLGIPLVEIVTGIIKNRTPEQVKEIALYLGTMLRTTGKVMRGIGTIRQDTNISIQGGERCEIKGLQDISMLDTVINKEIERQQKIVDSGKKVLCETRTLLKDGNSKFLRPLPGAARMYPETDVPPVKIDFDFVEKLQLPKKPEQIKKELMSNYKLNEEFANKLVTSIYSKLFYSLAKVCKDYKTIADVLLNKFVELRRAGIDVDSISDEKLLELFTLFQKKKIDLKAIPEILKKLAVNPEFDISKLQKIEISEKDLEEEIKQLISKHYELKSNKHRLLNVIMGEMMKKYRGKVSGKLISELMEKLL